MLGEYTGDVFGCISDHLKKFSRQENSFYSGDDIKMIEYSEDDSILEVFPWGFKVEL